MNIKNLNIWDEKVVADETEKVDGDKTKKTIVEEIRDWTFKDWFERPVKEILKVDTRKLNYNCTKKEKESIVYALELRADTVLSGNDKEKIREFIELIQKEDISINENVICQITTDEIAKMDYEEIKMYGMAIWEFGSLEQLVKIKVPTLLKYSLDDIKRIRRIVERRFYFNSNMPNEIVKRLTSKVIAVYLKKKRAVLEDVELDNELYVSEYKFYDILGYQIRPSSNVMNFFRKKFRTKTINENLYYSKSDVLSFLNNCYDKQDTNKILTDFPKFVSAKQLYQLLGLKTTSLATLREIGAYHIATGNQAIGKAIKTVYDIEDVKKFAIEKRPRSSFAKRKLEASAIEEIIDFRLKEI